MNKEIKLPPDGGGFGHLQELVKDYVMIVEKEINRIKVRLGQMEVVLEGKEKTMSEHVTVVKHQRPITAKEASQTVKLLRETDSEAKIEGNPVVVDLIFDLISDAVQKKQHRVEISDRKLRNFILDTLSYWQGLGYDVDTVNGNNLSWSNGGR